MIKTKYDCDICDSKGKGYFNYNSTYGYCNDPKCEKEARYRLGSDIYDTIEHGGSLSEVEDLIGDGDIFEYI